jgi:hypothetical protein
MNRDERGDLTSWAFLFVVLVFFAFVIYNSPRNSDTVGLQGGNIEKAIREGQYK